MKVATLQNTNCHIRLPSLWRACSLRCGKRLKDALVKKMKTFWPCLQQIFPPLLVQFVRVHRARIQRNSPSSTKLCFRAPDLCATIYTAHKCHPCGNGRWGNNLVLKQLMLVEFPTWETRIYHLRSGLLRCFQIGIVFIVMRFQNSFSLSCVVCIVNLRFHADNKINSGFWKSEFCFWIQSPIQTIQNELQS